jgi:flagellar protein FliS
MKATAEQKYLETAIATASKEDLIIRVFDVLVMAAQQAYDKLLYERNDIEGIHRALLRAQRACAVLMGSLDMEIGGEVAANLLRVYEFWHHQLVTANMRKDIECVERVLGYAKEYRETWMQAVAQFKLQKRVENETGARRVDADGGVSSFAAVG